MEYLFRPCVRSPHGQRWNIDVRVVLDWLHQSARGRCSLGRLMFMCIWHITRLAAVNPPSLDVYIRRSYHVQAHTHAPILEYRRACRVCLCLVLVFVPSCPSTKTADGHGPPRSGVPLFFPSRRPGEDGQDVTLSQAGESLPLDERVLRFGGCKAR